MQETYIVKAGDTLYGISNQFGVKATEIYTLNNLTSSNIKVGQVLKIPTNSGNNPSSMFIYTVKKGDSLYTIAKKYDTTVQDILSLNRLTSTALSIGQQLRIPESDITVVETPPAFVNYVVQKGDNLYSIARRYNLTVSDIMKDNGLTSTNLSIGQNLKIRTNKTGDIVVEECIGEDYTPPVKETTTTYTVSKGDSLYSIAKKFNTTVDSIKSKNNLTSNLLSIGQKLII